MATFTFWRCVLVGWADAWRYVCQRPVRVMSFFLIAWLAPYIDALLLPDLHPPFKAIVWVPFGVVGLARVVVLTALPVDVLRFLLLDAPQARAEPVFGRSLRRYVTVTWASILAILCAAVVVVGFGIGVAVVLKPDHFRAPPMSVLLAYATIVAVCLGLIFLTRLNLLFTHVAIGGRVRVADAWRDSRGHFWSISATQGIASLPLFLFSCLLIRQHMGMARPADMWALLGAIADVTNFCVGAGCAGCLYRRYAQSLKNPGEAA